MSGCWQKVLSLVEKGWCELGLIWPGFHVSAVCVCAGARGVWSCSGGVQGGSALRHASNHSRWHWHADCKFPLPVQIYWCETCCIYMILLGTHANCIICYTCCLLDLKNRVDTLHTLLVCSFFYCPDYIPSQIEKPKVVKDSSCRDYLICAEYIWYVLIHNKNSILYIW